MFFVHVEIMVEVSRREKQAGIVPDPDVDAYMKVPKMPCSQCSAEFQWSNCD